MPKKKSVEQSEPVPHRNFPFLRKAIRGAWIVVILFAACYSVQGVVRFHQTLQTPPETFTTENDTSLESAMCSLDLAALGDPMGGWHFNTDAEDDVLPLLPFPGDTLPVGSRLDRNGQPVFQFFSVEISSKELTGFWKSNGWTVKEFEPSSASPFFVQCTRVDQTLNVWSTDPPQNLQTLAVFKGQ